MRFALLAVAAGGAVGRLYGHRLGRARRRGSSDPPNSFTIADWSRCLVGLLDRLDIGRASLVGLSWGGLFAQDFYRQYASHVVRLVLTGTYVGWKGSLTEDVCRARLARCEGDAGLPPDVFAPRWAPEMFTDRASGDLREELSAIIAETIGTI